MKVAVYLSGRSQTGAPWSWVAPADSPIHCEGAQSLVRQMSGGCPVTVHYVDYPDEWMVVPSPTEINASQPVEVSS